jgi:hypothetical protein
MTSRSEVLSTADHLVSKDRADVYGPPRQSFGRIGALWGAMLGTDAIPPATVALMLVQLKVSRIVSSPGHEDSWVDLAGYAALGGELATGEADDAAILGDSTQAQLLGPGDIGRAVEFIDRGGVTQRGTLTGAVRRTSAATIIRLAERPDTEVYLDRTTVVLFRSAGDAS